MMDKIKFFEAAGEGAAGPSASAASDNKLEATVNKIYQNHDIDNKAKIAQLRDLFNNEIVTQYKKAFENVVKGHSECTKNEYLKEFNAEKKNISENVMKKYEMLSQEY